MWPGDKQLPPTTAVESQDNTENKNKKSFFSTSTLAK